MSGKNITQFDDQLTAIEMQYFIKAIKDPREEIKTQIRQLRMLKTLDKKKYSQYKKHLPYVVCGIFKPPFRRKTNFAHIQYFILDIDNLFEKGVIIENLKEKLFDDIRVVAIFESPGGDGLKLVFKLKERCYDEVKYTIFYKVFAKSFSEEYKLNQHIDTVTSDVTRACFISHDPKIFYRDNYETIEMNLHIDFENIYEANQTIKKLKQEEKESNEENKRQDIDKPKDISDELLNKIKQTLNPNIRLKKPKNYIVPEELNDILDGVIGIYEKQNIKVIGISSINYGKKFQLGLGLKKAEINLFYGKKGFTVVISPKNGTDDELNQLCHKLLCEYLFGTEAL